MNIETLTNGIWQFSHPYKSESNIWRFSINGYLNFSGNTQGESIAAVPWKISNDIIYIDFMSRHFLISAQLKDANNLEGLIYKKGVEHICEKFQAVKIGELNLYYLNDYFEKNSPRLWDLHFLGHGLPYVIKLINSSEIRMFEKENYDKAIFEYPDFDPEIEYKTGTFIISGLKLIIKLEEWERFPLNFTYEHPNKYSGHIPIWQNEQVRYYAATLVKYKNLLIN